MLNLCGMHHLHIPCFLQVIELFDVPSTHQPRSSFVTCKQAFDIASCRMAAELEARHVHLLLVNNSEPGSFCGHGNRCCAAEKVADAMALLHLCNVPHAGSSSLCSGAKLSACDRDAVGTA